MQANSLLTLGLVLLGSCSAVAGSLDSSAKTSAASFDSVSRSSQSGGGYQARVVYTQDVMAYTWTFLDGEGEPGDFARGLSQVAEAHGINDWEDDPDTLAAVAAAVEDPRVDEDARARLRDQLPDSACGD